MMTRRQLTLASDGVEATVCRGRRAARNAVGRASRRRNASASGASVPTEPAKFPTSVTPAEPGERPSARRLGADSFELPSLLPSYAMHTYTGVPQLCFMEWNPPAAELSVNNNGSKFG